MCLEEFGTILEDGSIKWLTVDDLIGFNEFLIINGIMPDEPIAVLNIGRLESSCMSPSQHRYYAQTEDVFELASVLMYSLIKNHCFANANKRTATHAGFNFLLMNGYEMPTIDKYELVDMIEGIAINKYTREELADWLFFHHEKFDTRNLCRD